MCLAIVLPNRSSVFPGVRVATMVCLRSLFFELRVTGGKLVAQTQKCVVKIPTVNAAIIAFPAKMTFMLTFLR